MNDYRIKQLQSFDYSGVSNNRPPPRLLIFQKFANPSTLIQTPRLSIFKISLGELHETCTCPVRYHLRENLL